MEPERGCRKASGGKNAFPFAFATVLLVAASGCGGAELEPPGQILDPEERVMSPTKPSALPSEDALEDALQRLRGHLKVPALGTVIVNRDGEIRLAVSGERAAGSRVAVERDDRWHLGSNTKAMTALLVARLAQDGRVSWDDRVAHVLRDRVEGMAEGWSEADLGHLLTHCGGLPLNASTLTMIRLAGDDTRDAVADRLLYASDVLGDPPQPRPGDSASYSNAGYVVAAAMLEARTGRSWSQLMAEELFEPLGLRNAGFGPPGSVDSLDAPRGHTIRWFGLGGLRAEAPDFGADNPPALGPAGRVHMSLSDYGTFLVDQLLGPKGEGLLLPAQEYRRLQGPGCDPAMAYGWGISNDGTLRHTGSNGMWYADVALWPNEGAAMAIVSNDGRVEHQRESFLRLMEEIRAVHLASEGGGGH